MLIEFTSTLTQEDENRLAPAIMKALSGVLDMLPIAYILRVETTNQQVLQHVGPEINLAHLVPPADEQSRSVIES